MTSIASSPSKVSVWIPLVRETRITSPAISLMVTFTSLTFGSDRSPLPSIPARETGHKPECTAFLNFLWRQRPNLSSNLGTHRKTFSSAGPQYPVSTRVPTPFQEETCQKLQRPPRAFRRGGGEFPEQGVSAARSNRTDAMSNWMSTTQQSPLPHDGRINPSAEDHRNRRSALLTPTSSQARTKRPPW